MIPYNYMITDNLEGFIGDILLNLDKLRIRVSGLELDHFGYQTLSAEDYNNKKEQAGSIGKLMHESIVGDRRVCIFKLYQTISYKELSISAFELIEPKEGQICDSSLEHIEFVIKEGFQAFIEKYPDIRWDLSAINRKEFPKVAIRFEDGTSVKFHLKSILEESC